MNNFTELREFEIPTGKIHLVAKMNTQTKDVSDLSVWVNSDFFDIDITEKITVEEMQYLKDLWKELYKEEQDEIKRQENIQNEQYDYELKYYGHEYFADHKDHREEKD